MRLLLSIIQFALLISSCLIASVHAASTTEKYPLLDRKFGTKSIPVELTFPESGNAPYPLIIYQHGSSRDGYTFVGGEGSTDEHGTRLKKAALANGFAFAALDAFYEKGLAPSDKTKFPKAEEYAAQLRGLMLRKYPQLDAANTFYSGFSYGGDAVMNQLYDPKLPLWTALVAAEPSCNVVAKPQPLNYPVLILKGTQSHYYPIACELVTKRHQEIGNPVRLALLEGGNHYFSLHGQIVTNGIAYNGCAKNPIFIDRFKIEHHDGTVITRDDLQKCFTKEGGAGKSRELLDNAIAQTITFFVQHKKPPHSGQALTPNYKTVVGIESGDCRPSNLKQPTVLGMEVSGDLSGFDPCHPSVELTVPDGKRDAPLLIAVHGGGGRIDAQAITNEFAKEGYSTLIFDAYKHNSVRPRLSNSARQRMIFKVAKQAYEWVLEQKYVSPKSIYIYGISNGASVVLNLAAIADPNRVKAIVSEAPTPVGIGYPWSIRIPTLIVFGNEDDLGAPIGQRRWMISSPCRFASVSPDAPKGTTEECSVENPSGRMLTTLEWVKRVRKEGASSIDIEYFDGVAHGAFLGELRKETFSQYSARGGLLSNNSTIDFGWSQGATQKGRDKVFSRMIDFLHKH